MTFLTKTETGIIIGRNNNSLVMNTKAKKKEVNLLKKQKNRLKKGYSYSRSNLIHKYLLVASDTTKEITAV